MIHLAIKFDTYKLADIIDSLGPTEKRCYQAARSAAKKVAPAASRMIRRDVATRERIPQKALGNRFKVSSRSTSGAPSATVWIGTWPIPASDLGPAKQGKQAVQAGRHTFPRAFVARMPNGHISTFIRYSSPHYTPRLFPRETGYKPAHPSPDGRYPIIEGALPIADEVRASVTRNQAEIMRQFRDDFAQRILR